jgi:hypothetical protein
MQLKTMGGILYNEKNRIIRSYYDNEEKSKTADFYAYASWSVWAGMFMVVLSSICD